MDKPAVPEDRWRLWAAFAILFAFAYLALSALGAAWVFPHRYAPAPTDFDTSFMGTLAANDATPLAIAAVSSTDDTVAGRPITVDELTFHSETSGGVDVRIFAALLRPRAVGPLAPALLLVPRRRRGWRSWPVFSPAPAGGGGGPPAPWMSLIAPLIVSPVDRTSSTITTFLPSGFA